MQQLISVYVDVKYILKSTKELKLKKKHHDYMNKPCTIIAVEQIPSDFTLCIDNGYKIKGIKMNIIITEV